MEKIYNKMLLSLFILTMNSIAFAQKTLPNQNPVQVADAKELNMLIRLAPYIDYFLLFSVAYMVFGYFVEFQTEKAFIKMLPIAFAIFIAFHWRVVLGWFGWFGI